MTRILGICLLACAIGFSGWDEIHPDGADFQKARRQMVEHQLAERGIRNSEVLTAMDTTPRHWFVPEALSGQAYADRPLPIGEGQTISQPYIVALMSELLSPEKTRRVLEIGTGSGYQAAVLAALVGEVFTIEIKAGLFQRTSGLLQRLGYTNINARQGDGYFGWPEAAPFDGIMITAAVDHIPPPLIKQLAEGGRLVMPLGNPFSYQNLVVVTKANGEVTLKQITGVLFVPMTGQALKGAEE